VSEHWGVFHTGRGGTIEFTTFAGGLKDGVCLQLDAETRSGPESSPYVQLTRSDVRGFVLMLEHWLARGGA
jgi:hypothetical protein